MCLGNRSGGKSPPASNGPLGLWITRQNAFEEASVALTVRTAVKWRALNNGPSCVVGSKPSRWRNSTDNSRLASNLTRSTSRPPRALFASWENIQCVHSDAGQIATAMIVHLPAICSSVSVVTWPASSVVRTSDSIHYSVRAGMRKAASSESDSIPRYFCTRDERMSHFVGDWKYPLLNATDIARCIAAAAPSYCTR